MGEILFLSHRIPFPPDRGDKIRSHHILKRLVQIAPVHVGTFADDADDENWEGDLGALSRSHCLVRRTRPLALAGMAALATGKPISLTAFHDRTLARWVGETLARRPISTIFVFSGQMAQYVPLSFAGRLVVDFVDVDSAKFDAYSDVARWPLSWAHAREGRLLSAEEGRIAARADASVLVTAEEAALFRARLSPPDRARASVMAVGNGIDTDFFNPAALDPEPALAGLPGPRLIFTGQMDYPPNVAAVVRATHRIMPRIRAAVPDATFHVVGRRPTAEVQALDGVNGCRVWGRVADVRPWLKGADMALVPLEIARGVQNKVLEAMAMALPVVASPQAATGIPAIAASDIAVGLGDADLAGAVLRLVIDPERARACGVGARRFVERHRDWDAMLAPLAALVDAPAGKGRRHAA